MDKLKRCAWAPDNNPEYQRYHDEEWGVPVYDDTKLFEMLILEGAQAGLSWETILKKREGYRKAFNYFNVRKCAEMSDEELEKLIQNPEIIRNRLKIFSVRKNALVFINIQKEFGSFSNYIWKFVDNKPIINNISSITQIPAKTELSDKISKDLKKRGMSFVGSTIIYAYMQAVGLVNDHTTACFRYVFIGQQ
ncbi:DNA-3-methyladenine glycosylase I [Paludibacter sp. 221]|uniref:DNA-3-methyladenine glycosylase I n=1 Tax=Paludibacter sp. 221 TaxID=2302939 RepID=UPI0013D308D5|nr:DNA-3-methyladenine glycosylase I [Paludibacter sp. 221]NDV45651.1 DNA-3-methyladenine glycosylase I [Paludibacter sp. 221]